MPLRSADDPYQGENSDTALTQTLRLRKQFESPTERVRCRGRGVPRPRQPSTDTGVAWGGGPTSHRHNCTKAHVHLGTVRRNDSKPYNRHSAMSRTSTETLFKHMHIGLRGARAMPSVTSAWGNRIHTGTVKMIEAWYHTTQDHHRGPITL